MDARRVAAQAVSLETAARFMRALKSVFRTNRPDFIKARAATNKAKPRKKKGYDISQNPTFTRSSLPIQRRGLASAVDASKVAALETARRSMKTPRNGRGEKQ